MDSRLSTQAKSPTHFNRNPTMLSWSIMFLIVAIIAGVLGFGGIAGTAAGVAKILFVVFLVVFLVSLLVGRKATAV